MPALPIIHRVTCVPTYMYPLIGRLWNAVCMFSGTTLLVQAYGPWSKRLHCTWSFSCKRNEIRWTIHPRDMYACTRAHVAMVYTSGLMTCVGDAIIRYKQSGYVLNSYQSESVDAATTS